MDHEDPIDNSGLERARRLIAEEREKRTGFLDLGNLGLTELPAELFELTHLRFLSLSPWYHDELGLFQDSANGDLFGRNNIEQLPEGLDALSNLAVLSLRGNPICDLRLLTQLPRLRSLDCSSTQVCDLGPLAHLPGLESLNCSWTQVNDLVPLAQLCRLQRLCCSDTEVSDLAPLAQLCELCFLDCSLTQVCELGSLARLTGLKSLNCSGAQVSDLEPLAQSNGLQSLDCSRTQVSDLEPLAQVSGLQSLCCSGTQVRELEPLAQLRNLEKLDCSNTQVRDLRPLAQLSRLQGLDCSFTQVRDLEPLAQLSQLRSLTCWGTPVCDLAPLAQLTVLQSLNCSFTQVRDLEPLAQLSQLRSLNCLDTPVCDLAPLAQLSMLQSLDCLGTQVSDLGPLAQLSGLQSLDCSRTRVRDLGPLAGLSRLRWLEVNGCQLDNFPRRLLFSHEFRRLVLHDTTIPGIAAELLSPNGYTSCLEQLRNHLLDIESAGPEAIREAKLVVLGNGRVGKTQICRILRGLEYDDSVKSTHAITVTSEPWAGSADSEVLNIWDFGGQDIYHGAHTLFMKTSAVFMIAWHPGFENTSEQTVDGIVFRNYPLPYWLEYVRTLGRKDSPVIVVQTRCDEPELEVKRLPAPDEFLNFPSLKPCWYSAKTNRGRGALDDALGDAIDYLRRRDGVVTVGAGRAKVLRQLEAWRDQDQARPIKERQHRTLSQIEFRDLCEQAGGVRSPESLLEYLHNLGVVFYQPRLFEERIILDQSWALDAIYSIFHRDKAYPLIWGQHGRFTRSLLALTSWREFAEPQQRLFLSLMESCGIAFVHRDADVRMELETEYLAPDILRDKAAVADQLAGRWDERAETRRVEFEYPFLHSGLMRTLICDVGRRSKEAGVYWKYGVWVYEKSTGCRVLLEQQMTDERRGRIALKIQGQRYDELARWLRQRMDDCNRLFGYPDLQPTVDDFAAALRDHDRLDKSQSHIPEHGPLHPAPDAGLTVEPNFAKPPASFYPAREPQVFISYAWGDASKAGQQRGKLVDDLCAALENQGVKVLSDRSEMRPGDRISKFMDRLAQGDVIIAVISDKYLRSEYCMYELFNIYRNCAQSPEQFLGKVIPLILRDAKLDRLVDRFKRSDYWTKQVKELEPLVTGELDAVRPEFFKKYDLLREFARNTSAMLEYLVDKLELRDFERQAKEGFKEVLDQVQRQINPGRVINNRRYPM